MSRSSGRAAPARSNGRSGPATQHEIGGPRQEDPQNEVDAVLDLQQAYGNQAVVQLLAAAGHGSPPPVLPTRGAIGNRAVAAIVARQARPATIQRAPNDDDTGAPRPVPAGATTAMGGASSYAPVPAGATTAMGGASSYAPVPSPAGGGSAGVAAPTGSGGIAPAGDATGALAQPYANAGGGPVPPGFGGNIDLTAYRRQLLIANAIPDHVVDSTFRRNPAAVIRSPHEGWHQDLWNFMRGVGTSEKPPPAFKVGNLIAVAPSNPSPATPLPQYAGNDRAGLGTAQAPLETPLDHTAPMPERPMIRAFAPGSGGAPGFGGTAGSVPGPQGPGRQTAVAVSTPDILAAMKADPNSVKRSPSEGFHEDMFRADLGKGSTTPTAFRVGNQILVSPNHPIKGVATLAIPGGAPTGGAPGTPAAPGAGAAIPQAGVGSGGSRRWKGSVESSKESPGLKGELGVESETTDGGTTRKKGKGAIGGIGGGKGLQVGGQSVESQTTGDATTTNKKNATLTLDPTGALVLGSEKSNATYKGTNADGAPIKTGETKTNRSLGLSDKGLTAKAGAERETQGGHKVGVSGGLTMDGKGNISGEGSLKLQTKGGTSLTPSISGGVSVQASDPIPAEGGGFDVSYTITSSSGVGLGASKQMGGGPSIGIQMGTTSGTLETGSRHFDDIKKAEAFRDKAAAFIAAERYMAYPPPDTVEGALLIPLGEERGTGDVTGSNYGGSVAFEGASLGYGRSSSTTRQFRVRHTHDKVVQVTGSVSGTKGDEVTGGGIISLGRGGSNTRAFEVVWEIDLATKGGRDSFEAYAKTGMPPLVAKMISMTSSGSEEDHDSVTIPLLGTAKWTGATWEVIREDARGRHAQFGGKQSRDQDPSWIGKNILGQDTIHSNAQITSKLETDDEGNPQESYEANITVSGTEGDETRKELGQIWSGVRTQGKVKPSGEWILSAQISAEVVRDLEKVNKEMRNAWNREDKMRAYSRLVKEHGIKMVGAQVGQGGDELAWSVELKGDKNFPGVSGRAALDGKRAELRGKLKDPKAAKGIVSDAQTTLDLLRARRLAVADRQRYTDLPDGLRDQQLKLIDRHISDFEFVRHAALKAALKGQAPAKPGAAKPDAATAGGYQGNNEAAESADMLKLRTQIDEKSEAISSIDFRINRLINALTQARSHTPNVHPMYVGWVAAHRASYQQHWDLGVSLNERQSPMGPKIDALRQRLLEAIFAVDRKAAAQELLGLLGDRLTLLETLHIHLKSAAEALKPITTAKGMKGYPKLWGSIHGDEPPWADPLGSSED